MSTDYYFSPLDPWEQNDEGGLDWLQLHFGVWTFPTQAEAQEVLGPEVEMYYGNAGFAARPPLSAARIEGLKHGK